MVSFAGDLKDGTAEPRSFSLSHTDSLSHTHPLHLCLRLFACLSLYFSLSLSHTHPLYLSCCFSLSHTHSQGREPSRQRSCLRSPPAYATKGPLRATPGWFLEPSYGLIAKNDKIFEEQLVVEIRRALQGGTWAISSVKSSSFSSSACPSKGYPRVVLGAVGSYLEPFLEIHLQKMTNCPNNDF
jgi:hypothetical protein